MRAVLFLVISSALAQSPPAPLRLEKTISLPGVRGRIDHLAADLDHQRLFVAALGNNSVEVIDVRGARRIHTITALSEPQGVLYLPDKNRLYVAGGGDGTFRIYDAGSYRLLKTVALGEDADNIRYDAADGRIYVGYGRGALGVIDKDGNKHADIRLDAHPESFQLETGGSRIFVNLPNSRKVSIVDRTKGAVVSSWGTAGAEANYPMALDEPHRRVFIVCRRPARLLVLDAATGALVAQLPTTGDCDDVFYDAARQRIYASGGEGAIAVIQQDGADHYREIARIPTAPGARTSLFVAAWDRLFLAARQEGSRPAHIGIYQAAP